MTDLERFEPQIRKEGRYREYMALVRLIGQVNKSFEPKRERSHVDRLCEVMVMLPAGRGKVIAPRATVSILIR